MSPEPRDENTELDDRLHGPESFVALVLAVLALMAVATLHRAWCVPSMFVLGLVGLALAVSSGARRRRIGMGVLAAVVAALVLRYMFWLFLWTIPGLLISLFV